MPVIVNLWFFVLFFRDGDFHKDYDRKDTAKVGFENHYSEFAFKQVAEFFRRQRQNCLSNILSGELRHSQNKHSLKQGTVTI